MLKTDGMKIFFVLAVLGLSQNCGHPTLPLNFQEPAIAVSQSVEPKWFRIIVMDVGQGDATLLIEPGGESALIDTGPLITGTQTFQKIAEELNLKSVKMIFISHNHEDHVGSLSAVLEYLEEKGIQPEVFTHDSISLHQIFALGKARFQVLASNGNINGHMIPVEQREDENNLSSALLVQYGEFRYLTSGDLPGGGGDPPYTTPNLEQYLAPAAGDVDIFLVPHHGSHTSSNDFFLDTIQPEVAILSVGDRNDFFHPHPSVIERLKARKIAIHQTQAGFLQDFENSHIHNDSICILTDGEEYFVKSYSIDKCFAPP